MFLLSRGQLLASAARRAAWRGRGRAAAESSACGRGNAVTRSVRPQSRGSSRKNIGGWPLIIWEAPTAKQNYYKTNNYIKHVEKLDLNYPEKNLGGHGQDLWGACAHWPQRIEPPLPQSSIEDRSTITSKLQF